MMTSAVAHDIIISKDEMGTVSHKITARPITFDRMKEIHDMSASEISTCKTREKMLWFNNIINKNTVHFTEGYNELVINRETLVMDSFQ